MRKFLALVFLLALPACGGGGGGSTGSSVPVTPTPTPTPTSVPTTSAVAKTQSAERTAAKNALSLLATSKDQQLFAGGSSAASVTRRVFTAGRHLLANPQRGVTTHARAPQASVAYSACEYGYETATTMVSATETQVYEQAFYDSACTQLQLSIFVDVTSPSTNNLSGTGTLTQYALSTTAGTPGPVTDYQTISIAETGLSTNSYPSTATATLTDAPSATAPTTSAISLACAVAPGTENCGSATTGHDVAATSDLGSTLSYTTTTASTSTGSSVVLNGTETSFSGGLNALAIAPATFPAFTITGGSQSDTATVTGTFGYDFNASLATVSATVTDATLDSSIALSTSTTVGSTGLPVITGTITQISTGTQVATFTVDTAGNGTITYNNGTTATITNWQING